MNIHMNTSEEKTRPDEEKIGLKRLFRSNRDYVLAGVAGGLGEYFNIDPVIIRVIFVFLGIFSGGTFLLGYIILVLIIPREPS